MMVSSASDDATLASVQRLAGTLNLRDYPLDGPLPDLPPSNAAKARQVMLIDLARRENLSIRQLARRFHFSLGHMVYVGAPKGLADFMQEWFESRRLRWVHDALALLPGATRDVRRNGRPGIAAARPVPDGIRRQNLAGESGHPVPHQPLPMSIIETRRQQIFPPADGVATAGGPRASPVARRCASAPATSSFSHGAKGVPAYLILNPVQSGNPSSRCGRPRFHDRPAGGRASSPARWRRSRAGQRLIEGRAGPEGCEAVAVRRRAFAGAGDRVRRSRRDDHAGLHPAPHHVHYGRCGRHRSGRAQPMIRGWCGSRDSSAATATPIPC